MLEMVDGLHVMADRMNDLTQRLSLQQLVHSQRARSELIAQEASALTEVLRPALQQLAHAKKEIGTLQEGSRADKHALGKMIKRTERQLTADAVAHQQVDHGCEVDGLKRSNEHLKHQIEQMEAEQRVAHFARLERSVKRDARGDVCGLRASDWAEIGPAP
eukprot:TRINITY_DN14407_c0_g2_i2.p2 TRINITY_DN14407_c0_g2~~TRINITY_DN14407_c0_g2_i2.p2  ORF type:complete len:161 (-),score=36.71 TRINITY_DN14407_c0_g2_i2:135-617(-)